MMCNQNSHVTLLFSFLAGSAAHIDCAIFPDKRNLIREWLRSYRTIQVQQYKLIEYTVAWPYLYVPIILYRVKSSQDL